MLGWPSLSRNPVGGQGAPDVAIKAQLAFGGGAGGHIDHHRRLLPNGKAQGDGVGGHDAAGAAMRRHRHVGRFAVRSTAADKGNDPLAGRQFSKPAHTPGVSAAHQPNRGDLADLGFFE